MIANIFFLVVLAILVAAAFVAPTKFAIVLMLLASASLLAWMAHRLPQEPTPAERESQWAAFLMSVWPSSGGEDEL